MGQCGEDGGQFLFISMNSPITHLICIRLNSIHLNIWIKKIKTLYGFQWINLLILIKTHLKFK